LARRGVRRGKGRAACSGAPRHAGRARNEACPEVNPIWVQEKLFLRGGESSGHGRIFCV
jgi:hypothetical protein